MEPKVKARVIKLIWGILVFALILFISVSIDQIIIKKQPVINWYWAALILSSIYSVICFTIIKGEEKALKIILGIPYALIDSGPNFIWVPIEKKYEFPKQEQKVNVPAQQIITIKGIETNGTNEPEEFSAATITVDVTWYFFWPDSEDDLIAAYQKGPDPYDLDAVKDFFGDAIIDATRGVGGNRTWRACTQHRDQFADEIVRELKNDPEGPVNQCCIAQMRAVVTTVKLPPKLEEAITKPQIADLEKQAAIKAGEGEKEKRKLIGEGDAAARQAIFNTIAKKKDAGLAYETLWTLRKMADGTSTTMFYGLPTQLNEVLDTALGGKKKTTESIITLLGGKEGIEDLMLSIKGLSKKFGGE